MKVRGSPAGLRRSGIPLGMPGRAAAAAGPISGMLAGVIFFPRGESLRELSQRRGFAGELSGIFPLFGGEACKKRAAEAMQPQWCWGFLGPAVVCAVVSHLAGLGMRLGSWSWRQREPRGRGAAAPGMELSEDRGMERGRAALGTSARCRPGRKVMDVERCAALAAGSLSVSAFL